MAVRVTYFGGMAVLLERSDGYKILYDPYLSQNPATKKGVEDVKDVDLLVLSHNAFDHFGDTVEIMAQSNAVLMAGGEVIRRVQEALPELPNERFKLTIYGDEQSFNGVTVRVMPAWHVSNCVVNGITIANPPFGFVTDVEPGVSYYHPGDTSLFMDMKMIREMYKPTIMAVGISGITKKFPCEMNPREAAYAVQWIGPDVVIPTHYEPGSEALAQFEDFVRVTAPKAIVKTQVDEPWLYTPFKVQ